MRAYLKAMAFGAAIVTSLPASAATVQVIQGEVSVNRGTGFEHVSGSVPVAVGNMVTARPGAKAMIYYADGCKEPLNSGAVKTIPSKSPCTSWPQPMLQAPNGNEDVGDNTLVLLGIGTAVGLGVACIVEWCNGDDDDVVVAASP